MSIDVANDIRENMIRIAKAIQQEFYELLPDWNKYEAEDFDILRQYIGYALDRIPENKEKSADGDEQIQYRSKMVSSIYDQITNYGKESDGSIFCSVLYNVTCEIPERSNQTANREIKYVPIFKIRNHSKVSSHDNLEEKYNIQYVDHDGRLYLNWNDYLTHNKLFPCIMVVPKNGYYEADLELDITEKSSTVLLAIHFSPVCSLNAKIVNHIDVASSVLSFGALGITALSWFTPIAPMVMLAGTTATSFGGVWMFGRSIHNLIDRKSHKESVSLRDRNALSSWISVAGYTMGFALTKGSSILSKVAQTGKNIGLATRVAYNTAVIGNISVNVACIGFNGYRIVEKYRENRKVDMVDVVSFVAHAMFFANTVLSTQFAHDIINSSHGKVLEDYEATLRSKRHRKAYNKIKNNANSKAEIVRYVRKVQSRAELFSSKGGNRPSDSQSNGNKPTDSQRNGNKPKDRKPRDNKPSGCRQSDNQPNGNKPNDSQPNGDKPNDSQPNANKPNDSQPNGNKLSDRKARDNKPNDSQRNANNPKDREPRDNKPSGCRQSDNQSNGNKPNDSQPNGDKPNDGQPNANKPNDSQPNGNKPSDRKARDKPNDSQRNDNKPRDSRLSGSQLNGTNANNEIKSGSLRNCGTKNKITKNTSFARDKIYVANSFILDPKEFINNFEKLHGLSEISYSFLRSIDVSVISLTGKLLKVLTHYYKYCPLFSSLNAIPEFKMLLHEMQSVHDAEMMLDRIFFLSMKMLTRCKRRISWEADLIKIAYVLWRYGKVHAKRRLREMDREIESKIMFTLFYFIYENFEELSTIFSNALNVYLNNSERKMYYYGT
uniref:uncharacterized protein LOC127066029 n=1 Tax=Vespula vulgaris TaxID=7454 RepID=UPI002124EB73|nr:uncharacterized protein LOC127066029 [Vespula vulgaris]XP_050855188.1 uncharacterized protein LOC127066029 [Vespula vulgaris]